MITTNGNRELISPGPPFRRTGQRMCIIEEELLGFSVNQDQKTETDRNKIKTHCKILHEVRQGSPLNLFGWLTSGLPDLGRGL